MSDATENQGAYRDPAEYNEAAAWPINEQTNAEQAEQEQHRKLMQEIAVRMLALLADSQRPRLTIWAMAFACELPMTEGRSEQSVARALHVTRAALNKECERVRQYYSLPRNRNNKSEQARKKYKEIAKNDHWRKANAITAVRKAIHKRAQGRADCKRADLPARANVC